MTRRPAWTDAAGLTHWTDEHGQIGHHTPRLGAGCKCGPTREDETGSGEALSAPLTASQPDQVSADPLPTPGLYGRVVAGADRMAGNWSGVGH